MKKYDTIFLDRDGTLNRDPGYINDLKEFHLFETTIPALKLLSKMGNRFCIITNQSGISRGIIQREKLVEIHQWLSEVFIKNNMNLLGIYWNADHPDRATNMRKPNPGMFLKAAKDHGISLEDSLMIGDSLMDIKSGENLTMDTMLVLTGNGKSVDTDNDCSPTYIVHDLFAGAELLMEESK